MKRKNRVFSPLKIVSCLVLFFIGVDVSPSYSVRCINILRSNSPNDYKRPEKCQKCHQDIFFSWRQSRHAQSWTSKTYVKTSENRSKEKCLPCHIPLEIKPGVKPSSRESFRNLGIYCVPCHLSEKSLHGGEMDIFSETPSGEKDIDFRDPTFCGSCHLKTLEEWKLTGEKRSCQKCHMKSFRQPVDHGFSPLNTVSKDIELSAAVIDKTIRVSLINRSIPHLYPTAENGDPRLFLYTRLFDRSGDEVDKFRETLAPQQDSSLGFRQEVVFEYEKTEETETVEIKLFYKSAWAKKRRMLKDMML
ncbi:MAG: multiheme c-type cytochrome [Nitrospinota bacterium]